VSKSAGNKIRRGKKYFNANVERLQSKKPSELSFGERLTLIRVENGLSQEAFGKTVGKSKTAITQYEMGSSQADYHTIKLISEIYNVSYDYLFGYSDSKIREQHNLKSVTGFHDSLVDKLLSWSKDRGRTNEKALVDLIEKGEGLLDELLFSIFAFDSLHYERIEALSGDRSFLDSNEWAMNDFLISRLSYEDYVEKYYTKEINRQKVYVLDVFIRLIDKLAFWFRIIPWRGQ